MRGNERILKQEAKRKALRVGVNSERHFATAAAGAGGSAASSFVSPAVQISGRTVPSAIPMTNAEAR